MLYQAGAAVLDLRILCRRLEIVVLSTEFNFKLWVVFHEACSSSLVEQVLVTDL